MRPSSCVILLACALAACSAAKTVTRGVDRPTVLLSDRPSPRPACRVDFEPRTLPTVAQLFDSVRLVGGLADIARRWTISDGSTYVLFSIGFDRQGNLSRVRLIDARLPASGQQELDDLLRSTLRVEPRGEWNARVRLEPAGAEPVRLGRSEVCPPESRVRFSVDGPVASPVATPSSAQVRVLVGANGRVMSSNLVRSTGINDLDEFILERVEKHGFEPGLRDFSAEEMWHVETVMIRAQR